MLIDENTYNIINCSKMSSVTFVLIMIELSWIDSNVDFKERCQCQREWRKFNRSNASTQICT